MADDEKNKVTSLAPPPTDEIDHDWGSSGTASSKPVKAKAAKHPEPEEDEEDDEDEDEDELDEDEDDDDEEEEDDEDDDDDEHRGVTRGSSSKRPSAAPSQDWLPDWAPWATLGALILVGFLGGIGAIPLNFGLTKAEPAATAAAAATTTSPKPATSTRPTQAAGPGASAAADQERVSASHLLVQYKGALRAAPTITRTKEEAKARAQEALAKAKKGVPFEKLVAEYSDEPNAAARGGKLGTFGRRQMVKPFADAAFALKPGQLSDVVETDFGYHVILRTQ